MQIINLVNDQYPLYRTNVKGPKPDNADSTICDNGWPMLSLPHLGHLKQVLSNCVSLRLLKANCRQQNCLYLVTFVAKGH